MEGHVTQGVGDHPRPAGVRLPDHWRPIQRLKNHAIYGTIRVALVVIRALPMALVRWGVAPLLWLVPHVARADTRRAHAHLERALGLTNRHERTRIISAMYTHLARSALELLHQERFLVGSEAVVLSPQQRTLLDAAFAEGKGVVAVTGHIGNWELLAQVLVRAGYPVSSVAKPLYDPRLTHLVHTLRTAHGMELLWRGEAAGAKQMLRVFKQNRLLALLIDQDTKVPGTMVPFFGRPAHTPQAPAQLALRFRCPVIVAWIHREPAGHIIHMERLPLPAVELPSEVATRELLAAMNARLEEAIRAHPEQWVWFHRRWRRSEGA